MFRARARRETPSRPSAARGSVGTARVWDERTRAARSAPSSDGEALAGLPLEVAPDELAALVAGIVQVTLDTRLADTPPARRAALGHELETRLLALFGLPAWPAAVESDPESPGEAPTPADPGASEPPAATETAPSETRLEFHSPGEQALGLALEDRLSRLGGPLADRADLRQRLIGLALARLDALEPEGEASHDELRSLDLLQRRVAKLEQALREARAALAYVSGLEHVDTGIASIYRHVQGLAPDDPQRERKRGALECLFRANLELQKPGPGSAAGAGEAGAQSASSRPR